MAISTRKPKLIKINRLDKNALQLIMKNNHPNSKVYKHAEAKLNSK